MIGIDLQGLLHDTMLTTLKLVAPCLIISLTVGLLISIFQAATQINEQTMTFVPKLLAIALTLFITGHWMMQVLIDFARQIFALMAQPF